MAKKKPSAAKNKAGDKTTGKANDGALFEKVMSSVAPLAQKRRNRIEPRAIVPATASATIKTPIKTKATRQPPSQPNMLPATAPQVSGHNVGMDKRQASRLRRGQLAIEATLDLHGDTQVVAHQRLRQFIHRCHGRGLRCVLVVTGKGLVPRGRSHDDGDDHLDFHKPATGVLRRNFPLWLAAGDLAPMILSHTSAQPKDGGSGAFYVLLRRRRDH
jgi:DNA-nicking Smr family endonuclease